jgi:hypothetical protein
MKRTNMLSKKKKWKHTYLLKPGYCKAYDGLWCSAYLSSIEAPLRIWILEAKGRITGLHTLYLTPQAIHLHPEQNGTGIHFCGIRLEGWGKW